MMDVLWTAQGDREGRVGSGFAQGDRAMVRHGTWGCETH